MQREALSPISNERNQRTLAQRLGFSVGKTNDIIDVKNKIYTRDLYQED
jgi:hypothetical protein